MNEWLKGDWGKKVMNWWTCERCDAVNGTVEATDSEAAEALGLAGEGAEGGVDVGVRER